MWILPENVVFEMTDTISGQLLGYGLETNSTALEKANGARDRLQRWLLFLPSTNALSDYPSVTLARTLNPNWHDKTAANDFIKMANDSFIANRYMYAVVNIVLTTPATIADAMAQVRPYPRTPAAADHQMDFRTAHIVRLSFDAAHNVTERREVGFVNAKGRNALLSDECWALLDAYPASPAAATTEYRIEDLTDVPTVDFVNLLTGTTWASQNASSLVYGKSAYFTAAGAESHGSEHA